MIANPIELYKNAYAGLSRENWYLSVVMFINRSGTMVVPFMTIYCTQQLGFTIVQAGIIMSLFGVGSILGAFFGGKITDKLGFYHLQLGALFSGGVLFISLAFLETFLSLAAGTFLLSMCNESFRPANSAAIAHYSSESARTRAYSLHRLAINLGWSFGGALGGFIASIDYHLLFYVDGLTNILAGILLFKLLPDVRKEKAAKEVSIKPIAHSAYRDKLYLAFIFLTIPFASSFFQFFILQPVFFKSEWHFTEQFIGGLMALNGIIIVATEMVLVHNLEGKRSPLFFISLGILVASLSYVALNVLPPVAWAAVISVVLITLGEMLSMPFMNAFWISRSNESNRGEYSALYTIAWSTAQIIGPIYGAILIQQGGFRLFWWFLTGICICSSLGFMLINYLEPIRKWKKSRYF
ncbi:MAG: MFS transporter [Daejeonella sp.]|uniref:MDR family MFS transporter n=1 Tax=Daejeonella sp. TaxID=2805397 RepID=UPI003C71143D